MILPLFCCHVVTSIDAAGINDGTAGCHGPAADPAARGGNLQEPLHPTLLAARPSSAVPQAQQPHTPEGFQGYC